MTPYLYSLVCNEALSPIFFFIIVQLFIGLQYICLFFTVFIRLSYQAPYSHTIDSVGWLSPWQWTVSILPHRASRVCLGDPTFDLVSIRWFSTQGRGHLGGDRTCLALTHSHLVLYTVLFVPIFSIINVYMFFLLCRVTIALCQVLLPWWSLCLGETSRDISTCCCNLHLHPISVEQTLYYLPQFMCFLWISF